jgi:hypothetical protein
VDPEFLEEGESGVEEGDGAGGRFIREELGEGQAAVVVDGDVEELPAGPADMIALTIASDAVAGAFDAGQLLDVEVEEFSGVSAFVAEDGRRWTELREAEAMAEEETRDRGFGEPCGASDLEAREPAATQSEHARHPQRMGGSGGTFGA